MPARSDAGSWRATLLANEARQLIDSAMAEAGSMAVPVTVAVVNESGVLKEFRRMGGAALVSVQTAISKAYAAAAIGMPPDEFYGACAISWP